MTNVAHASLTGSELHEPKGVSAAPLGTVYVANGAGSGSWENIGTSSFTGMIADFVAPVVPNGWLELDGSVISTSTFSGLYAVMTITTSGSRTNSSPVVTSIADTSQFRVGYFVFGTGINAGTTIVSIDSASQITLSSNATSSGTAAFAVSPWAMNTGTITLPNVSAAGRYRRSRTASTAVGQVQADSLASHTHTGSVTTSGTTDSQGSHSHSINDPGHAHSGTANTVVLGNTAGSGIGGGGSFGVTGNAGLSINAAGTGISLNANGAHTHSVTSTGTFTTASTGSVETRPVSLVVMTCVKT